MSAFLKHYVLRYWRSHFVRSVAAVATGTAGAQAINMAFAPIITRLYSPESFGLLGTFMALVTVIMPLAALAYPIAIVLPKEESEARGLVRLALGTSAVITTLAFLLFGVAGKWILSAVGAGEISSFSLLIPLVMLFSAWLQIAQQWLIRLKAFKATAKAVILQSLIINSAKSSMGLIYPFAAVLISLQAVGIAMHALLLGVVIRRLTRAGEALDKTICRPGLGALARQYRDFPIYRAPQNFINAASMSLPVLMLASFFGPAAAGFYSLGQAVIGLPSSLIAQSVGTVFYPRITQAAHHGESLQRLIVKTTIGLAVIGLFPFASLYVFGPWLFSFAFGADWMAAGEYASWLSLMYFFNFINRPCVAAVPVLGLQRGLLIYEVFSTGTKVLALYLGYVIYGSDQVAVALFSLFGATAYIVLVLWIILAARNTDMRTENESKTS